MKYHRASLNDEVIFGWGWGKVGTVAKTACQTRYSRGIEANIKQKMEQRVTSLEEKLMKDEQTRMGFYLASMTIDLVKLAATRLGRADILEHHSSQTLTAFGESLDNEQLIKCEIPVKHKVLLSRLRKAKLDDCDRRRRLTRIIMTATLPPTRRVPKWPN